MQTTRRGGHAAFLHDRHKSAEFPQLHNRWPPDADRPDSLSA
jgi:hypothetical protein